MKSRCIFVKSLKTDTVFEQVRRKMTFTKLYHNHIVKLAKSSSFWGLFKNLPTLLDQTAKKLVDTIFDQRQAI